VNRVMMGLMGGVSLGRHALGLRSSGAGTVADREAMVTWVNRENAAEMADRVL